jgi:hypothetical protein
MNRNEILIVIVLLILLGVVILQIIKKKETFSEGEGEVETDELRDLVHNKETCNNFPFDNDECSDQNYMDKIYDFHVQVNSEQFPEYNQFKNIHIVNPKNPCCLRTCINDFTYTEENTPSDTFNYENILGTYKADIPQHIYFASKCSECLDNYYVALKHINRSTRCEEEDGSASFSDDITSSGCSVRI